MVSVVARKGWNEVCSTRGKGGRRRGRVFLSRRGQYRSTNAQLLASRFATNRNLARIAADLFLWCRYCSYLCCFCFVFICCHCLRLFCMLFRYLLAWRQFANLRPFVFSFISLATHVYHHSRLLCYTKLTVYGRTPTVKTHYSSGHKFNFQIVYTRTKLGGVFRCCGANSPLAWTYLSYL